MQPGQDIQDCGILIVEDDYLGRVVLKEIFKKQGFTRVEEAENGKEGLEKLQSFKPNLIIMDVLMPEMDGVECCSLIRKSEDPEIARVPILVQTALDKQTDKSRLFSAGATDYISKPVDPHELTARAVVHLERESMMRRLREYNTRMAHELDMARTTQQVLIPDASHIQEMEAAYGLEIHSHYRPCSELGGDFWGMKSLSNDELAIYMVDFSGHGVNAALNVFRLHALMQAAMDTAKTPGTYLAHLNAILAPLLPRGQFATMFYGVLNKATNALSYASAATPAPVLFARHGQELTLLEGKGSLLGAMKQSTFETHEIPFRVGDCLMLYSDALIETRNASGDMPPIDTWAHCFQKRMQATASGEIRPAFEALMHEFQQQCMNNLTDDLTLSAICRRA